MKHILGMEEEFQMVHFHMLQKKGVKNFILIFQEVTQNHIFFSQQKEFTILIIQKKESKNYMNKTLRTKKHT